jgi:hypothetical protein
MRYKRQSEWLPLLRMTGTLTKKYQKNKNIFFIQIGNTIIYNSLMKNNYSFNIYGKNYENINK